MKLYPHQQKFVDENPNKALVCFNAGTGKSLAAMRWMEDKPAICIVSPKSIKQDWVERVEESSIEADVYTKEEFKKADLSEYKTMVFDEVHHANSPLFTKGRSQITTKVYEWIKGDPERFFLGLTATPISSNPWNIHTLMTFTGNYIDWKKFRDEFFSIESPPYMKGRMIYMPKPDWRKKARALQLDHSYTARMSDIVDGIPEQFHETVRIPLTKSERDDIDFEKENPEHESDVAVWYAQHRLEQTKSKIKKVKEIAGQFSKVLVYAKYKTQIADLEKALSKERQTFVMTGDTKDQGEVIRQAQEADECYFIVQADISEGYELKDFPCVIWASQSWRKISDVQAHERVQRLGALKENFYYYILSGPKDKKVFDTLAAGEDFIIR